MLFIDLLFSKHNSTESILASPLVLFCYGITGWEEKRRVVLNFVITYYYFDVLGSSLLSTPLLRSLPDLRSGICIAYVN